jgi:hypothetical protein
VTGWLKTSALCWAGDADFKSDPDLAPGGFTTVPGDCTDDGGTCGCELETTYHTM